MPLQNKPTGLTLRGVMVKVDGLTILRVARDRLKFTQNCYTRRKRAWEILPVASYQHLNAFKVPANARLALKMRPVFPFGIKGMIIEGMYVAR